ncbi:MAG: hypothetical protein KF858_13795 [Candidatus Sumerlaeia bacterium]|nr:hypothetical protein [Candidatus Sumerlaeia bacterium]
MTPTGALRDWRVVLVSPQTPENVGAVARLVANFGAAGLTVVDPRCAITLDGPAGNLATRHAHAILHDRREAASLAEALADCHGSIALTMQSSADRPAEFCGFVPAALVAAARPGQHWALVLGREDRGLTNEECARCTARWSLPTDPDSPSLNVAQAAAIALAGVAGALAAADRSPAAEADSEEPATQAEIDGLIGHLDQVLVAADYERGVPMELPLRLLRRAAGRAGLRPSEVRVLRGVCRRVLNAILGHERRP